MQPPRGRSNAVSTIGSNGRNCEAAERERLRRDAQGGVCSICGRTAAEDAEPQIQHWARRAATLEAELKAYRDAR